MPTPRRKPISREEQRAKQELRRIIFPHANQNCDRDMLFYCRGWNMALTMACAVLQDIVMLRDGDCDGLGIS